MRDREQAFGLVPATKLRPAEALTVAAFAVVLAGAGDWLLHETASKHKMTAVKLALRPDM